MERKQWLIGVDIGGTKCAVCLAERTETLTISDKVRFETETWNGPDYALGRLETEVRHFIDTVVQRGDEVVGIGISCGGPLDSRRGVILSPPNLPGWDAVPIVQRFEERFSIPTAVQNDANACALAEWKLGAARGHSNVIFLTFGTGMGAGLILDGKLYAGTSDMAGEVGHLRLADDGPVGFGKAGSFEGFCSGGGIVLLARRVIEKQWEAGSDVSFCRTAADLDSLTTKAIAEAALAGDETARDIFRTSGEYLGKGLCLLIDILNPEIIVIGSIFARQQDLLWPHAQEVIEREAIPYAREVCKVVPAGLGERIGDYASLCVAVNMLDSRRS